MSVRLAPVWLSAIGLAVVSAAPPREPLPPGRSAAESLKAIRVGPGLRVELAAAEPLVLDPIAFDWSADGRLWVVEMGDYPLGADGKGKPGGQVRVLRDVDGDGRYDEAAVFLDGLANPTGLIPWRGGVLVASAPDILYAEDRDGDGRADRREVLFTGFRRGNPQHLVNGFELGLDGWVYGANGDSGGVVRSLKTGASFDVRGRDFRFRPDDGRIEPESGQTQFGRHRDDWGRWFGNSNSVWAWQYVFSDADLRRNRRSAPPDPRNRLEPDPKLYPVSPTPARFNDPKRAGQVTSANSPTPYRDDLLGPGFENSLFVSEPVHNLVHRMTLEPDGPTLKGRRASDEADREFLASEDPWFRPTMLKTGPDGALWVADMDRAVIEHPEWIPDDWEATLDLRAGSDRGRIFRVLPDSRPARPIPRLDRLDTPGLVAALDSPNGWQRDTAHRLLLHRADPACAGPLRKLVATTTHPKTRVQALAVLENLDLLTPEAVLAALRDPHEQVRRFGVHVFDRLKNPTPEVADAFLGRADDASAAVRFEAVLAFGRWADPRAGRALGRVAVRDGRDPWFQTAVLSAAPAHARELWSALFGGEAEPPEGLVEPLYLLLAADGDTNTILDVARAVGKPSGPGGRFAPWQYAALAGLLDAARQSGKTLAQASTTPAWREAVARLDEVAASALRTAADREAPEADRLAALKLVGRDPGRADAERTLLAGLLTPQTPVGVQTAAVAASARGRDPKLPAALLDGWPKLTPAVRSAVLDALLARREWSAALLSSLEDACTPPAEIDPAHRRRLLENADGSIRDRARAVFGGEAARKDVLAKFADALTLKGDPRPGRAAFEKLCATCHKLGGVGREVGPDLASLDDRSPGALFTAILDPNRAFEAKYGDYAVQLTDGRVKGGIIASETAAAITLRRQQGEDDVIPRVEVESLAATGKSLMPEGIESELTPQSLADLIAFLAKPPR